MIGHLSFSSCAKAGISYHSSLASRFGVEVVRTKSPVVVETTKPTVSVPKKTVPASSASSTLKQGDVVTIPAAPLSTVRQLISPPTDMQVSKADISPDAHEVSVKVTADNYIEVTFKPRSVTSFSRSLCVTDTNRDTHYFDLIFEAGDAITDAVQPTTPYQSPHALLYAERQLRKQCGGRVRTSRAPRLAHTASTSSTVYMGQEAVGRIGRQVKSGKAWMRVPESVKSVFSKKKVAENYIVSVNQTESKDALDTDSAFPMLSDSSFSMEPDQFKHIYEDRFHHCLYLERMQALEDIRAFDRQDIKPVFVSHTGGYVRKYRFCGLTGLAESRPSLCVGDKVGYRVGTVEHQGRIVSVELSSIVAAFSRELTGGGRLRFIPSVAVNIRMHTAVRVVAMNPYVLSRLIPDGTEPVSDVDTMPRDHLDIGTGGITLNPSQRRAQIIGAAAQPHGSPVILFGTPGSGKTSCVVATAATVIARGGRVLLCAPTNDAADILATRLLELMPELKTQRRLVRALAYSRNVSQVPSALRPLVLLDEAGHGAMGNLETMQQYLVVVSTCSNAFRLPAGLGLTHVMVDEAAACLETDVLCALSRAPDAVWVLIGDPRQLGPIVSNNTARQIGFGISLLDRLLSSPGMSSRSVMLNRNYRSLPEIIQPSSRMFYNSKLQAAAPRTARMEALLRSRVLPAQGFPFAFYSVMGRDMREGTSSSWFNPEEVSQVAHLVSALVSEGIPPAEIGVISPYHQQGCKIRRVLHKMGHKYHGVTVGTVEKFQGSERDAIIISTVRSCHTGNISSDIRHALGFVANPRRLNVAVTRARGLVAVVGNPMALSLDPHWSALLRWVARRGGATGDYEGLWDDEALARESSALREELERKRVSQCYIQHLSANVTFVEESEIDEVEESDPSAESDEVWESISDSDLERSQ
eukprot:gnl/Dysnectes_brevis/4981_a6959_376.p1 GENE.gnl/Dysnectes_brevis/4981_a6959_376~~gnl/Dysnectes_brevis/4981_a6959_376.p1  ORF type:complete len:1050 (+),score=327.54 gnl/Dysnectes_brevis/4981_a6959_376:379-3150(+)